MILQHKGREQPGPGLLNLGYWIRIILYTLKLNSSCRYMICIIDLDQVVAVYKIYLYIYGLYLVWN